VGKSLIKLASQNQFFKFVIVGLLLNIVLYGAFILLTWLGVEVKLAMTTLYVIGILYSFKLNKDLIFSCERSGSSFFRFIISALLIYCMNYSSLLIFYEFLTYPYQYVQAVSIVFLALLQYVLNKYWIFNVKVSVNMR